METSIINVYIAVSVIVAIVDIVVMVSCLRKHSDLGRLLAHTVGCATAVDLTYLFSILSDNYFFASVMTSAYFVSIDWMVLSLVGFIFLFTNQPQTELSRTLHKISIGYACFETVLYAINPFWEVAVTYVTLEQRFAQFRFQMLPLFYLHLAFTYIIVVYSLLILIRRIIRTPAQYRSQYSFILAGILLIVAVNCTFLYLPQNSLLTMIDYSICMYSLVILLMYWDCFKYTQNQMLSSLSLTIFENIGQGIVLFDYEGNLVMKNARAQALLPSVLFSEKMSAQSFLMQCNIPVNVNSFSSPYSLQCYVPTEAGEHTLRCDYRPLKDKRGRLKSSLYVFTDAELETDLLTGFHKWPYFKRFVQSHPNVERKLAVAVFDITGLAIVNSTSGVEEGDRQIRELAKGLRKHYPKESYFVRGHEATLMALCFDRTEQQMLASAVAVAAEFPGNLQYAVSAPNAVGNDTMETITVASRALQIKKLMDQNSPNSQVLTSLIRALKECDSDTEAHVKRTQELGEKLGQRIGLSDSQRSSLRLLCLLHDIGKIGIPLDVLNKPGKLSAEEWNVVRSHVEKGYQIASSSEKLSGIADMILHHHERWDGNGYPSGLSRESIPLLSRVIALVDAFDAMTNDRLYRRAMTVPDALHEIRRCAGTQFDPYIAAEFIRMLQEEQHITEDISVAADIVQVPASPRQHHSSAILPNPQEHASVFPVHFSRYLLDDDDYIVDADETFFEITGYTAEEALENHMTQLELVPPEDRTEYIATVSSSLSRSSTVYLEHKLQRKDGTSLYVFCFAEKIFDSTVKAARTKIIISDIYNAYSMQIMAQAENNRAQERLKHWEDVYRSDSLTGLLTHTAFRNDVEQLLLEKSRVVMLALDLDHFKTFNDTFGHVAGDELLVLLSRILRSACTESDLLCRIGGDEFAVALFVSQECPDNVIAQNVRQIYDKVSMSLQAFKTGNSISMGCAVSGDGCTTFKQLYTAADEAMYTAKQNGRAKLVFGPMLKI